MRFHRGTHQHVAETVVGLMLILFLLMVSFLRVNQVTEREVRFGVTFSIAYAEELRLDWQRAYAAVLDELHVSLLRVPVYWDRVEVADGIFDWSEVDFLVSEAQKRGAQVTLAIGRKVPRWPECYVPTWVKEESREKQSEALLAYVREVVVRYEDASSVVRFQVENEPLYPFGECPLPDPELFGAELALTRELSRKPIMLTVSGENETWIDAAIPADVLGVSVYRTTWNDVTGYFIYPLGAEFYRLKMALARPFVDAVVLSELQAEPWFQEEQTETSLDEQARMFTASDLHEQVALGKQIGFDEVYVWGVEWWYWMKMQGEEALWLSAYEIF